MRRLNCALIAVCTFNYSPQSRTTLCHAQITLHANILSCMFEQLQFTPLVVGSNICHDDPMQKSLQQKPTAQGLISTWAEHRWDILTE